MSVDRVYVLALRSSKEDCGQRVRAGVEIRKMYNCYITALRSLKGELQTCWHLNHKRTIFKE